MDKDMIPQIDPELQAHCDATWLETIASIEVHSYDETLAAVKRATGFDAIAIDITDPLFDAKMRAARENWKRQS